MRNNFFKAIPLILILTFVAGCKKQEDRHQAFNQYVNEKFGTDETPNSQLYFFLPDDACPGLIQTLKPYINTLKAEKDFKIIMIARSEKKLDYVSEGFENRKQITYDTDGKAYDYNILSSGKPTLYVKHPNNEIQVATYTDFDTRKMQKDINGFLGKT
jgi:hypothetical protein